MRCLGLSYSEEGEITTTELRGGELELRLEAFYCLSLDYDEACSCDYRESSLLPVTHNLSTILCLAQAFLTISPPNLQIILKSAFYLLPFSPHSFEILAVTFSSFYRAQGGAATL